ncbi:MAG: MFS transporter [Thermoprotei archaeon]
MNSTDQPNWLNRDVLLISFSAFFADLGYQGVFAAIPIVLVQIEQAPPYVYGVVMAFSFGLGSLLSYAGGIAGDRYGRKKVAILGNSLIPLLSFSGLPSTPLASGTLFAGGWISRNFRTPARRAMLVEATNKDTVSKAFGFLHALDVGGGFLSALLVVVLLAVGFTASKVVLYSVIPLIASTLVLVYVKRGGAGRSGGSPKTVDVSPDAGSDKRVFRGLLVATAIFGLSTYSLGFPVLTILKEGLSDALGVATYAMYLGSSAIAGYALGSTRIHPLKATALAGYGLASVSSLAIAAAYFLKLPFATIYVATAGLGVSAAAAETFEPVLVSRLVKAANLSKGMGSLGAYRSLGLFVTNLVMGFIFTFSVFDSYVYAALSAAAACIILLYVAKPVRKQTPEAVAN